jgi:hypothetical protein
LPSRLQSRNGNQKLALRDKTLRKARARGDRNSGAPDKFRGKLATPYGLALTIWYMETLPTHEITELLQAWNCGEEQVLEKLTPLIYDELYRSAKRSMSRGRRGNSMQTTALINELYVRMLLLAFISVRFY